MSPLSPPLHSPQLTTLPPLTLLVHFAEPEGWCGRETTINNRDGGKGARKSQQIKDSIAEMGKGVVSGKVWQTNTWDGEGQECESEKLISKDTVSISPWQPTGQWWWCLEMVGPQTCSLTHKEEKTARREKIKFATARALVSVWLLVEDKCL